MEKPILFSTPMVQAILDGRKTMTRRIVKPQINDCKHLHELYDADWKTKPFIPSERGLKNGRLYCELCGNGTNLNKDFGGLKCPYGKPGDVLTVKETFYAYGHWTTITENGKSRKEFHDLTRDNNYLHQFHADWKPNKQAKFGELGWHKRPSLFMPKSACRIWLEVTSVKVERLQEITEADAIAEGMPLRYDKDEDGLVIYDKRNAEAFETLWSDINGPDSWKANPWVWVIEFKRIETHIKK